MKWKRRIIMAVTVLVLLTGYLIWQNNDLTVTHHEETIGLDEPFKVVHLSDLHSKSFGEENRRLIDHVEDEAPDMIVITGDLVDQNDEVIGETLTYIGELTGIAPVHVVSGNHEYWSGLEDEVRAEVEREGAHWMDGQSLTFTVGDETLQLIGLADPVSGDDPRDVFESLRDESTKTFVLSHRAAAIEWLREEDVAMVFSGHVHGGMVRLPLIGGLYGPDQGLFPEYSSGIYHDDGSSMVVSRGLGNSVFPLRIFNRPDIVAITFE